jgi:hypothetical protein
MGVRRETQPAWAYVSKPHQRTIYLPPGLSGHRDEIPSDLTLGLPGAWVALIGSRHSGHPHGALGEWPKQAPHL